MNALAIGLKQAATVLGLSHWTLRQWIRKGRIRAVRLGRRVLIEPSELTAGPLFLCFECF
jgi:excisionase family DNA binding protein